MKIFKLLGSLILLVGIAISACAKPAANDLELRLYRLDCGSVHMNDMSVMSDTGDYRGRTQDIVVSCYLIKHGDQWMLWDAGLSRDFLKGVSEGGFDMRLTQTIADQLGALGLTSGDIGYIAISHAHFDHTGQSNDFPNATLILQKKEYEELSAPDAGKHLIDASLLSAHVKDGPGARLRLVDGDQDLFGDGLIKTIALPGHTPGQMGLMLKLKYAGVVILSGDQWHFTENRVNRQVPKFNFDHDATLASGTKLEGIIKATHATLIIGHEPDDVKKIPVMPGFLN